MQIPDDLKRRLKFKSSKKEPASPPTLVSVEYQERPCKDCGRSIKQEKHEFKHYVNPSHWRTICQNCKHFYNPKTGNYDINQNGATAFFKTFYKTKDK